MLRESHTTYFAKGSIAEVNLLGEHDSVTVVKPCTLASAMPFCTIASNASAAGESVPCYLLGQVPHPIPMKTAGAVTVGKMVYTAASGRIQSLPSAAGTYYMVGIALETASASGDTILVSSCIPQKIVVEQPI